ncbi:MAG: hypothetical protein AAF961_16735, partial [Planctomycetota bacterium]
IVMTNGPFLETTAETRGPVAAKAVVGEDLACPSGELKLRIRVQCPNWHDVNRVQIFVNGRPLPEHNYTRRTHREMFGDEVVKFDQEIPLTLEADAAVLVATIGEGLALGRVAGPDQGTTPPVAVANPIYVDTDGDGFEANGEMLGLPLPVD